MEHTVKITSLVYEGYGFGHLPDGKAVFVPFVLPGEKVRIRIKDERKRHAFGDVLDIVEQSADRISPRCKHFEKCGGCHYQHIPYDMQLEYKREIFIEQLQRMGGIEAPHVAKVFPSPNKWHYRNTIQFHLTEKGALAYMDASDAQAFKVEECFLPMEEIGNIWPLLAFEKGGQVGRVEIRQNKEDEVLVNLHGSGNEIPEIEVAASLSMVYANSHKQVVISGDDYLMVSLMGRSFRVSAASFFQTNFACAETLVRTVQEMAEGMSGILFDLYCGVGIFSSFLADSFDQIISVEASTSACADFIENLDAYDNVSLYEELVRKALPKITALPDCAVVDPPRSGMNRYALDALVEKRPPAIIYISCNPSTLARDVKRLGKSGYRIARSVIVDMFPQTYHIESVNLLTLA
ncbi:MAG: class I SAM-dependent RNA methyltransferase [Anaerolineaceae bacterium]|nr:class I SAM-dependent RNA methyltransferase [Anaerolineaceae bacterium]